MWQISAIVVYLAAASSAVAWDGFDHNRGVYVEIEKGNTVRSGNEIEFFDHGTLQYRTLDVDSVSRSGSSVTVEGYDPNTGEYLEFEMDGE